MTIEPSAVYPPGTSPASPSSGSSNSGQQGRIYVIQSPDGNGPKQNVFSRTANRIPAQQQVVSNDLSMSLPHWLRGSVSNRAIVFNMWIIAMIVIAFDEWHNLGILPRPARLWDTSLVYGILILAGFVDPLVPIVDMLAIGYTIMLIWQYFQGNITPQSSSTPNATSNTGVTGTNRVVNS